MNLTNLRSIHMGGIGRAATDLDASDASTPASDPVSTAPLRLRKVMRTPTEEFQARVAQHGPMQPFPDALAAILHYEHKTPTLTQKSEISISIMGTEHKFYHPDCLTCHPSNAGKQIRVSFDRDDLSCVFVLSEDGRYLETVPSKGKTAWFGKDAAADIAKHKRAISRVAAHLDRIHAPDNKAEHDRAQSNAEKLQYLNEFPVPSGGTGRAATGLDESDSSTRDSQPSTLNSQPRFNSANEIVAAAKAARLQQERHREAEGEKEDLAELARQARMAHYKAPSPTNA